MASMSLNRNREGVRAWMKRTAIVTLAAFAALATGCGSAPGEDVQIITDFYGLRGFVHGFCTLGSISNR